MSVVESILPKRQMLAQIYSPSPCTEGSGRTERQWKSLLSRVPGVAGSQDAYAITNALAIIG
jgi:hypothetical protein